MTDIQPRLSADEYIAALTKADPLVARLSVEVIDSIAGTWEELGKAEEERDAALKCIRKIAKSAVGGVVLSDDPAIHSVTPQELAVGFLASIDGGMEG